MQRNIMAIDNFYGIAAGKNFVIYSFLCKDSADVFRKELSLGFHFTDFRTSISDKFCSLRPNINLSSTDFFLDSQIRPSSIRFYVKYWYS